MALWIIEKAINPGSYRRSARFKAAFDDFLVVLRGMNYFIIFDDSCESN